MLYSVLRGQGQKTKQKPDLGQRRVHLHLELHMPIATTTIGRFRPCKDSTAVTPVIKQTMIGMDGMLGGPSRVQIEGEEDLHMKTAMHKCKVRQCGVRMPFKNVSPGCRTQVHRRVEVAMGGSKDVCTCT